MKQALLLLNMGGPSHQAEVELFLRNMFADKYILPMHPWVRKIVAHRIVSKRLEEAQENYRHLGGKSPLLEITMRLIAKLQHHLAMPIYPVMRYVPPFAQEVLHACQSQGIEELILFPMYPHYSTTTTRSSVEDLYSQAKAIGYHPKIRTIAPYYDHYHYIEALYETIMQTLANKAPQEYTLVLSAHGLPLRIIQSGDPYQIQIEKSVSALKTYLACQGVRFHDIVLVYQSKVGKGAWLEPNLADFLRNPRHKKVLIVP